MILKISMENLLIVNKTCKDVKIEYKKFCKINALDALENI